MPHVLTGARARGHVMLMPLRKCWAPSTTGGTACAAPRGTPTCCGSTRTTTATAPTSRRGKTSCCPSRAFVTRAANAWRGRKGGHTGGLGPASAGRCRIIAIEGIDEMKPTTQMELAQQLDEAPDCVRVVATARPGGAKALIAFLKARFAKPYVRTQRLPKQVSTSSCWAQRARAHRIRQRGDQGRARGQGLATLRVPGAAALPPHLLVRLPGEQRKLWPARRWRRTIKIQRCASTMKTGRREDASLQDLPPPAALQHHAAPPLPRVIRPRSSRRGVRRDEEPPWVAAAPFAPTGETRPRYNFNRFGRCIYDHPDGVFNVKPFSTRCPVTTLVADAVRARAKDFFGTDDPAVLRGRAKRLKRNRRSRCDDAKRAASARSAPGGRRSRLAAQRVLQRQEAEAEQAKRDRRRAAREREWRGRGGAAARGQKAGWAAREAADESRCANGRRPSRAATRMRTVPACAGHGRTWARVIWAMQHDASALDLGGGGVGKAAAVLMMVVTLLAMTHDVACSVLMIY